MIRLRQLLPEQVMKYWDELRPCIEVALPPHVADNPTAMLFVQEQLLLGMLVCWVATEDKFDDRICGVMTTQIQTDEVSKSRNLLIFSLAIIGPHTDELWQVGAETMRKYAAARECTHIVAYSNNDRVVQIANQLGADSSYKMIVFKI